MNEWKERISRIIKDVKEGKMIISKNTMAVMFLLGVLLYVIMLPVDGDKDDKQDETLKVEKVSVDNSLYYDGDKYGEFEAEYSYKELLEDELEEFLCTIEGVGEVKAMIYMPDSQEYVVEKDNPTTNSQNESSKESIIDEATVYTTNEEGEQVPFIAKTLSPKIGGVVVAAKGAGQEEVRLKIVKLIMALFSIEANKVEVVVLS